MIKVIEDKTLELFLNAVNFLKAAFAGIDPSTRRGSEAFLKIVNGEKQSGRVRLH